MGPNLTQYPTAPPGGFVPPSIQVVPGPATIAGSPVGPSSPGGVAGVQMTGVAGVALPSAAGGPHALPPFPSFPLPQGFPNPFAMGPISLGGAPSGAGGGSGPGQTVTGPQGYFPGIGWVGQPGGAAPPPTPFPGAGSPYPGAGGPALGGYPPSMPFAAGSPPMAPGAGSYPNGMPQLPYAAGSPPSAPYGSISPFAPGGPPPAYPGGPFPFPGGAPAAFAPGGSPPAYPGGSFPFPGGAPGGGPRAYPGGPAPATTMQPVEAAGLPGTAETATPGPFWLHLGWQLLQTAAVRQALGDLFEHLVRGPNRLETINAAAKALTSPHLQSAFEKVTAGQLDQSAFTRLFAEQLKAAVGAR